MEVAVITGVSLRQLQWWDEQGIVTPMQKGHRRLYRMREVIEVVLITEFAPQGDFTAENPQSSFASAKDAWRLVLYAAQGRLGTVFADRRRTMSSWRIQTAAIVRIVKESNQPIIAVCITDQIARLNSRAGLRKQVKRETKTATPARVRKVS